jgi:hypothetical protein
MKRVVKLGSLFMFTIGAGCSEGSNVDVQPVDGTTAIRPPSS